MAVNAAEKKSVVGIDNVYFALVTEDSADAYTTGTPVSLAPVATMTAKPVTSQEMQYADNQAYDAFASEAETDHEYTFTNVPPETLATLTGKYFDATTGRVIDVNGIPPYVAIGFRALKSNGKYRYYWYHKVQFVAPEEGADTKADKITPKTLKMTAKALQTIHQFYVDSVNQSIKRIWGDEDTTNFSATSWFSQVQVPGSSAPSALALSSSTPADEATNVSASADVSLTFNNALTSAATVGVSLIKASDGSVIAGTKTLNSTTLKTVTINPTSNLDASTVYILTYGVTDIYGQTLSGAITFTTAA
jgi:phi13 family phage major tail protein